MVIEKIPVYKFMRIFHENIINEYARHTHRAWWLDLQFKLCKDTFPLDTIVSVVEFTENYTLQPKNELWTFSGRLLWKDNKISEPFKLLIKDFWTNDTRVFSNQRDVVRRRIGSQNYDPHAKIFYDSTQT